ncbi:dihydroorotate dehydrogenase B (NAD(+)), catalytic subunit [Clostridia bacterium]|nr:dihydroorotate dehydrogenase B (NAD(+)), catalytic subunit [Clostridia bacterium]
MSDLDLGLAVKVGGVSFRNPLIAASGTFGNGLDYTDLYPADTLGGISCKGLTLEPRPGNPCPRIAETASGMLNSVGLQNYGAVAFIREILPAAKKTGSVIIANIAGSSIDDYAKLAYKLDGTDVDMLEVNVSCPNVKEGGASFGVTAAGTAAVTKAVRKATTKPVMVKLTPNVTDITETARAAESEGADAVSLINTLLGMKIDIKTRKPVLRNNTGGLSGAAVFPVALRMVWQTARAVKIDVVGLGGITTAEDVIAMMLAGAKAVQIGTAIISDPFAPRRILTELADYLTENNIGRLSELTGKLEVY